MELTFTELRSKEVVNTQDGRKLGRIFDMVFCWPENRWLGVVVPNGKVFCSKKQELFIELKNIVKIGEDVVLVNVGLPKKENCGKRGHGMPVSQQPRQHDVGFDGLPNRRNYEEFE